MITSNHVSALTAGVLFLFVSLVAPVVVTGQEDESEQKTDVKAVDYASHGEEVQFTEAAVADSYTVFMFTAEW